MQRSSIPLVCILLGQTAMAQETVYVCRREGKVIYAASPRFGECRPVDLKVLHPSQEELERLAREKERKAAEETVLQEQQRQEREVRAREEATRAARRQARAAERQAEYEREQLRVQERTYELEKYRQPDVIFVPRRTLPRQPAPTPLPE